MQRLFDSIVHNVLSAIKFFFLLPFALSTYYYFAFNVSAVGRSCWTRPDPSPCAHFSFGTQKWKTKKPKKKTHWNHASIAFTASERVYEATCEQTWQRSCVLHWERAQCEPLYYIYHRRVAISCAYCRFCYVRCQLVRTRHTTQRMKFSENIFRSFFFSLNFFIFVFACFVSSHSFGVSFVTLLLGTLCERARARARALI